MNSEPITPKAERRIIDGQVIDEVESSSFSGSEKKMSAESEKTAWWRPRGFSQFLSLLLWLLVIGVIGLLLMKQQSQDWQIEQINQLQSQVGHLSQDAQVLKKQQNTLSEQILSLKQDAADLENKPVISQADVQALKEKVVEIEGAIAELSAQGQAQVSNFMQQAQQKLDDLLHKSGQAINSDAVQQPVDALKQQLQDLGAKVSELMQSQATMQAPQSEATAPTPLSAVEVQKWILEINAQWLLQGNVVQTRSQLMALEQASGLSEFPQKMALMRLIGEDLAALKVDTMTQDVSTDEISSTLRAWLAQQISYQPSVKEASHASSDMISGHESTVTLSPWQRLQEALVGLFRIKKRESADDLTLVERTLMQDVILQRAYLLVDQCDWAIQMHDESKKQRALANIRAFVTKNFVQANDKELSQALQPYEQIQLTIPQPLKVVGAL